jgi:hypothetical protein
MGGVVGQLGTMFGGGPNNSRFEAQSAPIINPVTGEQSTQSLNQNNELINAIQAQGGIGNQSDVYNRLKMIAEGNGPNPAQTMLNAETGKNIAAQGALMAGQRGASVNPALIARMAARRGAELQQNAVGQGATLQANQSLGALQGMGNIAGQQVGNQIQTTQSQRDALLGAINNSNMANVANTGNMNTTNQKMAEVNAKSGEKGVGGLLSSLGTIAATLGTGGAAAAIPAAAGIAGGIAAGNQAHGGLITKPLPPHLQATANIYHSGGEVMDMNPGGKVPGQAPYPGDTEKNDTQPALLTPGEVVIPKSIMESKDPVRGAAQFVAKLQKEKGMTKSPEGDFKQALKAAIEGRKKKK